MTGTFDDWGKTEKLDKVGETFERDVELPSADQKILYKFVVDGEWVTDPTAPKEDDGHHNVNNVLLPEDIKRKGASGPGSSTISSAAAGSTTAGLAGLVPMQGSGAENSTISSAAAGSTTAGMAGQVPLESSKEVSNDVPGGFPETPAAEEQSYGVNPIPASSGAGNPVQAAPGEQLPDHSEATGNTLGSNVTTSQDDYEKAGTSSAEPETISAQPIPASSGIGNPVNLQPGEKVPDHEQVTGNKIDSNATTSKEDYDKAGSGYMAAVGGGVAAAGAAAAGIFGYSKKDDDKKNMIPESSLPMGEGSKDLSDAGPTIQSAGAGSTTAGLAAGVPMEEKRKAMVIDPADAPSAQAIDKAVPDEVQKSMEESNQSPEAATSAEAVQEKSAMEKELLAKVPTSEAHGETASAAAAQTSYYGLATQVPRPVEESMQEAKAAPEAAADTAVVSEKSDMEKELLQKVKPEVSAGEPAPTLAAATSATAPGVTDGTTDDAADTRTPGASTNAAAAAAVSDGAGEEGAVATPAHQASTEKTEADATEYAPPSHPSGLAPGVSPGAAAALSDGTEDPTLAEEPAVQMMNQNEATGAESTEPTAGALTGVDHVHSGTNLDEHVYGSRREETDIAKEGRGADPIARDRREGQSGAVSEPAATSVAPVAAATEPTATAATPVPATENVSKGKAVEKSPSVGPTDPANTKSTTSTPSKIGGATAGGATAGAVPTKSATSTPSKPTTQSSTSTPASTETKERKKKNRVSAFFKKIFD